MFDGTDVVIFHTFEGTGFSNQVDGYADGRDCLDNVWNLDLKALYVVALPDLCSKICDGNDDVELFAVLKERVDVPCGGIALP